MELTSSIILSHELCSINICSVNATWTNSWTPIAIYLFSASYTAILATGWKYYLVFFMINDKWSTSSMMKLFILLEKNQWVAVFYDIVLELIISSRVSE